MIFIFCFAFLFLSLFSQIAQSKLNECTFSYKTYNLGDRWSPSVEHPLNCMRCGCINVAKNPEKISNIRVKCKDIKKGCPKPNCENPILLENACCSICPGQNVTEIEEEVFLLRLNENNPTRRRKMDSSFRMLISSSDEEKNLDYKDKNYQSLKYQKDEGNSLQITGDEFKCYYGGKIYTNGGQWRSLSNKCEMCFCNSGRYECIKETCPKLKCKNKIQLEGQCCSVCESDIMNTQSKVGCYLSNENTFYPAGASFYPFLPPNGFFKCVVCKCMPKTLLIKCKKVCSNKHKNSKNVVIEKDSNDCNFQNQILKNDSTSQFVVKRLGKKRNLLCYCKDKKVKCKKFMK